MPEPPPPYSMAPISQNITPQRNPDTQLARYLIEIMAFSFNTDFTLLNEALGQDTLPTSASVSTTSSTLYENERAQLLHLALISKDLNGKLSGHEWLTTRDSDRLAIKEEIIIPALQLDLSPDYILEIISTYADHRCDEMRRDQTLISQQAPPPVWLFRGFPPFLTIFGHHVHSHARIIRATAPDEPVRILLGNAMRVFQEQGLGVPKISNWRRERWPGTGSWYDLWKDLISEEEESDITSYM